VAIWILATVFIVMPDFVEIVFIQLSNEAGKITVLKMFWQD